MTARPTDDELRAMLEARAGSVSHGAAGEILASARAEIAGPSAGDGAGVSFGIRRVEWTRRRSTLPWGIAAIAASIVVALAVFGGRVALDRPRASGGVAGSSPLAAGAATPPLVDGSPTPSGYALVGGSISGEELGDRLRTGELDGKTIVVRGRLMLAYGRCRTPESPAPGSDCVFVRLDGLPDVFIDKGDRTADETQASIDRFGQATPVVLRGTGQTLRLVGWLVAGAGAALQPDGSLLAREQVPAGGVIAVMGWLQGGNSEVQLTTEANAGGKGIVVHVASSMSPADFEPAHGTFLVRPADTARLADPAAWEVVGRIDATTAVFVDQPRTNLAGPTITATDLMAAIRDGSLDGQILAIDGTLQTVAWDCPLDAPEPCQRFYVDGLPGVAITWDGGSSAADASGAMDPYTGRLLVTPRHGRLQPGTGWLELLGVLHGDLARPVAFATLAGTFPAGSLRDTLRVDAVDGWLVVDGPIFCALIRPGGTPCPQQRSLLTPSAPTLSGELTAQDNLPAEPHRGAPGIGASPIREVGPFLVRQDLSTSGWVVVGRYDPNGVRVVTFP